MRRRPATAAIIIATVVTQVLAELTDDASSGPVVRTLLFARYDFNTWEGPIGSVSNGQLWRIFTPGLLSFGLWPLLLHVTAFVTCAGFIERLWGWRRLSALYLLSTAVCGLPIYLSSYEAMSIAGAAVPAVAVIGCALVLAVLSEDRTPQGLGVIQDRWGLRLVPLAGSRRLRGMIMLLVAYWLTAWWSDNFEPIWVTVLGIAFATGVVFALVHALLTPVLARRVTAAVCIATGAIYLIQTMVIRHHLYRGPTGGFENLLDTISTVSFGAAVLATLVGFLIRRPGPKRRARLMRAAEGDPRAYAHEAAEYALLSDDGRRSRKRETLVLFGVLAVVALILMGLYAAFTDDDPHSLWFYLWFSAVGVCPPVLGIVAGDWAHRARQHDAYAELNGPYADQMVEHVATRRRQVGAAQLVAVAAAVLLTPAAAMGRGEPLLVVLGAQPFMFLVWHNVFRIDRAEAIRTVFRARSR